MKKSKIHTEMLLFDSHFPKQNKATISCFLQAMRLIKPDGITLGGDIGDWDFCSRHSRFSPPKCHWTDTQFAQAGKKQYEILNGFLDKIQKISPKSRKRWHHGNHEVWVKDFIKESPDTRKQTFGVEEKLDLKGRGYTVIDYNDFSRLGKLWVTHGIYTGMHHAKKHVDAMGHSVLYGHVHDIQIFSKVTPAKISHMAFSAPCSCNLNPEYLRNKPQNWNHGFVIVYVWPSGNFQVDIVRVNSGKCVVQGKELVGK